MAQSLYRNFFVQNRTFSILISFNKKKLFQEYISLLRAQIYSLACQYLINSYLCFISFPLPPPSPLPIFLSVILQRIPKQGEHGEGRH
jgi:hypothetical protein